MLPFSIKLRITLGNNKTTPQRLGEIPNQKGKESGEKNNFSLWEWIRIQFSPCRKQRGCRALSCQTLIMFWTQFPLSPSWWNSLLQPSIHHGERNTNYITVFIIQSQTGYQIFHGIIIRWELGRWRCRKTKRLTVRRWVKVITSTIGKVGICVVCTWRRLHYNFRCIALPLLFRNRGVQCKIPEVTSNLSLQ